MFIGSVGEAVVKLEARQKPSQVWLRLQVWLAVLRFHCKVSAGGLRFLAPQICLPSFIPLLNYYHTYTLDRSPCFPSPKHLIPLTRWAT